MKRLFARLMLTLLRPALELHEAPRQRLGAEQARVDAMESDRLPWRVRNGRVTLARGESVEARTPQRDTRTEFSLALMNQQQEVLRAALSGEICEFRPTSGVRRPDPECD